MSTGALENKPQEKSGRAIALPAPPPPRSLHCELYLLIQHILAAGHVIQRTYFLCYGYRR